MCRVTVWRRRGMHIQTQPQASRRVQLASGLAVRFARHSLLPGLASDQEGSCCSPGHSCGADPALTGCARARSEVAKFCQKYMAKEMTRLQQYHEGNLPDSLIEVRSTRRLVLAWPCPAMSGAMRPGLECGCGRCLAARQLGVWLTLLLALREGDDAIPRCYDLCCCIGHAQKI